MNRSYEIGKVTGIDFFRSGTEVRGGKSYCLSSRRFGEFLNAIAFCSIWQEAEILFMCVMSLIFLVIFFVSVVWDYFCVVEV